MRARYLPFALLALSALPCPHSAAPPPVKSTPEQIAYAKLTGDQLVKLLPDPAARTRAYYELWRRAEPRKDKGFEEFAKERSDAEVIVCPQAGGLPPVYLVLYRFREEDGNPSTGSVVKNPWLPFNKTVGLVSAKDYMVNRREPVLDLFNSAGRQINPYHGANVLSGALIDANGDGLIERVEIARYGLQVLRAETVEEQPQQLLNVVINWDADEWGFQLTDKDGDGVVEIEAGPWIKGGIRPVARWTWDAATARYTGPEAGEHFRVIHAGTTEALWKELEQLRKTGLRFPADMKARGYYDAFRPLALPWQPKRERVVPASLKGATDAEVFRWMADAPAPPPAGDDDHANELAAAFWQETAKSAAAALLKLRSNRASELTSARPPSLPRSYTITFSGESERGENRVWVDYFLRVDPRESYLAFAQDLPDRRIDREALGGQPSFDLRFSPVAYVDARRVGEVLALLHVGRLTNPFYPPVGTGNRLTVRAAGKVVLERCREETLLWNQNKRETDQGFLQAAGVIMTEILPDRLGAAWRQMAPKFVEGKERPRDSLIYPPQEQERLGSLAEQYLHSFSLGQEKISWGILAKSAGAAAYFRPAQAPELLQKIARALPPAGPPMRDYEVVREELRATDTYFPKAGTPAERKKRLQQRAPLVAEFNRIDRDMSSDSLGNLRRTLASETKKLALMKDPERLYSWAISKEPDADWAMEQLAAIAPAGHAEALAWWVGNGNAEERLKCFETLTEVDRERALALAQKIPPVETGPLALAAFVLLRDAGAMPEEAKRVQTLLAVLRNPESDWQDCRSVVLALVPSDAPLRFPGHEVDEAIFHLFEFPPERPINYVAGELCRALTHRGRTEYFERIVAFASELPLSALVEQAQLDLPRFRPTLLHLLKPELEKTSRNPTELLWAIWAADLRELAPELELLATHDPDEMEDARVHRYGGGTSPLEGRFHLARRILSLWHEPDPLTRVRMLLALRLSDSLDFDASRNPEQSVRLIAELRQAGAALSPADKAEVSAFLERLAAEPQGDGGPRFSAEEIAKVTTLARQALSL